MSDAQQLQMFFTLGCCLVTMALCWRIGWEAGVQHARKHPQPRR